MGCGLNKNSLQVKDPVNYSKPTSTFSKFTLGNYEIQSQLLKLPYSILYNAKQISADLSRTLKLFDLTQPDCISLNPKHLESEISHLKSLDHINILRIYDMFPLNNKFCIIMEPLTNSVSLFDFIPSLNSLTESNVTKIISQILSAVCYCHSYKVIHRDLNPKLIFVTNPETLHIKISEFGSSAFMDPESSLAGKSFDKAFTAPEVFQQLYNEKCDLWSVGVIMYLLLIGRIPEGNYWDGLGEVNPAAVDLMKKLMEKDFNLRISAAAALQHPWITSARNSSVDIGHALKMLKQFSKVSEAQDAVREFIADQIISYNDSQYFIENFQRLDSNNDGRISKEELLEHYKKSMNEGEAKSVVESIFEVADRNRNGTIEYAEFVRSSMKKSCLLSIENIEKAFRLLDKDNSENLSIGELEFLLGDTSSKDIRKIIENADVNGDGQISFPGFLSLLKTKFSD